MPSAFTVIGKYQVVDRLADGGMGTLYLARDPSLDRLVAIKVLRGDFDGEEPRERFSREARSISRLRHPNIVTIFEYGEFNNQPFIAMEYIAGESLAELIRRRATLPLIRRLQMMEEVCAGMAYAHGAQIVHRDLKPANIMVDAEGGLIKILDFGIASRLEASTTGFTQVIGTPSYMSPEQAAGKSADHRSDIFSIGAVFYELLGYRKAFGGESQFTILDKIQHGQPAPIAQLIPSLDSAIVRIVIKALERDPDNRYQDLDAMRRDIGLARERIAQFGDQTTMATAPTSSAAPAATPWPSSSLKKRRADQIKQLLETAQAAIGDRDYNAAIASCEQVLLLDHANAPAIAMIETGRTALEGDTFHDHLQRARELLDAGALNAAERALTQALTLHASDPAALAFQRELQQIRSGHERTQERAAAAESALARAQASFADGAFESAVRAASEVFAHTPESVEARRIKGSALAAIEKRALEREENAPAPATSLSPISPSALPRRSLFERFFRRRRPVAEGRATSEPSEPASTPAEALLPQDATIVVHLASQEEPSIVATIEADRRDATLFLPKAKVGSPSEAVAHARLIVADSGQVFMITSSRIEIGRTECDINIADSGASRRHAAIEFTDGGFSISDLGSSNGTFLNGRLVRRITPLFFGAAIRIGATVMIFRPESDTSLPDLTGCQLGERYTLTRKLRESQKGVTYAAMDRNVHSEVAVKLLSPQLARYSGYRAHFEREVKTAALLFHPNICRVLDSGPAHICASDGSNVESMFLSYALMAGGNLAERLAEKVTVPVERIATWIDTLASALEHSHRRGIVHGDLKPTAIVFDQDENVYLSDFAIGQGALNSENHPTFGSPAYMSPEQWEDGIATPATDQFALAAIAYYILTGSRPFEGQDNPEIRQTNFRRGPIAAHKEAGHNGRADLMPAVSTVLRRALSPTATDRFASVEQFAKAFRKAIKGIQDAPQVFLSYHRRLSSGWANNIADKLKDKYGLSVFIDVAKLDSAGQFPPRVAEAIRNCSVFVCLLAEMTLDSDWIKREIRLAHEFGKTMIPVMQESFVNPELHEDEALRALMSSQGVRLLDVQNIYVDQAIAAIASLVTSAINEGED